MKSRRQTLSAPLVTALRMNHSETRAEGWIWMDFYSYVVRCVKTCFLPAGVSSYVWSREAGPGRSSDSSVSSSCRMYSSSRMGPRAAVPSHCRSRVSPASPILGGWRRGVGDLLSAFSQVIQPFMIRLIGWTIKGISSKSILQKKMQQQLVCQVKAS